MELGKKLKSIDCRVTNLILDPIEPIKMSTESSINVEICLNKASSVHTQFIHP